MNFKELILSDFGIYAGKHCLRFSAKNGSKKNIILIGGMNGRGKTTILEAVLLVLYGNRSPMFRESKMSYSAYLRKCINKANSDYQAYLELLFEFPVSGAMLEVKVRRSWQGTKQRLSDYLQVWRNGYPDDHLSKNWDTYVEELLPVGVSGLFFFDAEKISRLAAEEETGEIMKDAIKSMLGIDVVNRLLLDMKRLIQKKQASLADLQLNETTNELEQKLQEVNQRLNQLNQEKAQLSGRLERKKMQLQEKEELFIKKGGSLKNSRETLLREKEALREKLLLARADQVGQASGPLPLLLVLPLLAKIRETIRQDEEIKTAKHVHSYLEGFSRQIQTQIDALDIQESDKEKLLSLISAEQQEIKKKQSVEPIFDLSAVSQQHIDSLLHKYNQSDLLSTLAQSVARTNELEAQLEQAERYLLVEIDEVHTDGILREIKELYAQTAELELEQKRLTEEMASLNSKKNMLENQILNLYKKAMANGNTQNETERIIHYAVLTQEIMGEFKKKVTLKKVFDLAERITASFSHIIGKESLVAKITIDPETLRLALYDTQGKPMLKSQLSAGEKQMLAIAILWGLGQASGHTLPIIIDTPLGRLDSSHRMNFIKRYLPKASHQVIVLSTDEEVNNNYLRQLESQIQCKYLLEYNETNKATSVVEGYFPGNVS